MNERKTKRITEKQYAALKAAEHSQSEIGKEQAEENKKLSIERNEIKIKTWTRERDNKETQIKNKEYLEKHEAFLDGKKPEFILLNEVDIINQQIKEAEEATKKIEEMEEKNG